MAVQHRKDFVMQGTDYRTFTIPDGAYKYIAVLNSSTDNRIELYQDIRTIDSASPAESLLEIKPYQNITILFQINQGRNFTIVWRDGGNTGVDKRVTLLFAEENPNLNFQGSDGTGQSTAIIGGDTVGLAKQVQLPNALVGGRLAVNVQDGVEVELTSSIPAGGNMIGKVGIDSSLPVGSNKIGKVDIDSPLPTGANKIGKVDIDSPIDIGSMPPLNIQSIPRNYPVDSGTRTITTTGLTNIDMINVSFPSPSGGLVVDLVVTSRSSNTNNVYITTSKDPNKNSGYNNLFELVPGAGISLTIPQYEELILLGDNSVVQIYYEAYL